MFNRPKKATFIDYHEEQGGKPLLINEGDQWAVHHSYSDDPVLVTSKRHPDDYGEVDLLTSRGVKRFKVGLLRRFHGEPCETENLREGGSGYERRR